MNEKALKFDEYLTKLDITWFEKEERTDEYDTVLYRTFLEIKDKRFPLFVILDKSIFTVVRQIVITGADQVADRAALVEYVNELNSRYKVFKYYLNEEEGILYMDMSIPAIGEYFDPEILMYLIGSILLPHTEEILPRLEALAVPKKKRGKQSK